VAIVFLVIIVIFFTVAFVFVLFPVRLLSKKNIDSYRPIRRV
jgi:ABC-type microcin C transport system permease subunit YejB